MLDKESNRRLVIPRWNTFSTTVLLGEVKPLFENSKTDQKDLEEYDLAIKVWEEKRSVTSALELLGIAYLLGFKNDSKVVKAAEFVLMKGDDVPNHAKKLADFFVDQPKLDFKSGFDEDFLVGDLELTPISKIKYLKKHVRDFPNDQIAWIDLSLFYTILGQEEKAKRAMAIAINLGIENRFLLRASTRLFSHLKEFDQALYWLKKARLTDIDPWLISAEISLSELSGRSSTKAKKGTRIIESKDYSFFDINELAASLGTLEFNSGSIKKSKKLFRKALNKPNENTLAQTESLAEDLNIEVDPKDYQLPAMYEAQARYWANKSEYKKALQSARNWFFYQPFSAEPAVFASYIAAVCLQDHKSAIEILSQAKRVSSRNFLVNNNLAFSYASLNKIKEAEESLHEVSNIELPDSNIATLMATKGLIEFRKGNLDRARDLYNSSIQKFTKLDNKSSLALAYLFLAREESQHDQERFKDAQEKALKLGQNLNIKEIINFEFKRSFKEALKSLLGSKKS